MTDYYGRVNCAGELKWQSTVPVRQYRSRRAWKLYTKYWMSFIQKPSRPSQTQRQAKAELRLSVSDVGEISVTEAIVVSTPGKGLNRRLCRLGALRPGARACTTQL